MSTQTEAQDVQSNETAPVSSNQDQQIEKKSDRYDGLTREELMAELQRSSDKIHDLNAESKGRKLKLRELEASKEAEQTKLLEEQQKFKELYEGLKERTKDYDELTSFRDSYVERDKERLAEQTKKLSLEERTELELMDDLPLEKKLKWVELRLNNRQTVNLDTSSSIRQGGSLDKMPQNRREITALPLAERLKFKEKHPQSYTEAMKIK